MQLDLGAHLHAQFGVKVGQRLIEQEDFGLAHNGAPHGDALALAAGSASGDVQQFGDIQDAGGVLDALTDLCLGEFA